MECLEKFMEDSYQGRLRLLAQSKSEQYEYTLENYKKIFLAHLALVKNGCEKECPYKEACAYIRGVIAEIQEEDIRYFFDELKAIFLDWIDARSIQAISRFESLLDKYDMMGFHREIKEFDIFFKGRETDEVLTSWDMFHIPFNKRYLIKNQRFSLTGQPVVYIGNSVIDIAEEIEIEDAEQLKISVIKLPTDQLKIYDLRSNIYNDFMEIIVDNMLYKNPQHKYNKSYFFRTLLASVCSFQKKQELKGFSFCEEYVLPQILAQIVKTSGFDGIAYYSTKPYDKEEYETDEKNYFGNLSMDFRENIAIFTKHNSNHVYDRELFEKINISVPVDIRKVEKMTIKDLIEVKDEINQSKEQGKVTQAEKIVSSFERIYGKMNIKGVPYEETDLGRLHIYELYTVLNQILVA